MTSAAPRIERLPSLLRPWRTVASEDLVERDELAMLLALALDCPTDYWPGLALEWLEDGFPVDAAIAEALRDLHHRRSISQPNRHRALRLIKVYLRTAATD